MKKRQDVTILDDEAGFAHPNSWWGASHYQNAHNNNKYIANATGMQSHVNVQVTFQGAFSFLMKVPSFREIIIQR